MIKFSLVKQLSFAEGHRPLEISIALQKGQFITLYGKSGAGKTSILRMLAGLLRPDAGQIVVEGNCWYDQTKNIFLSPQQRQVGFLFQDYALFPNMSVRQNLVFALQKHQPDDIIGELMELMELEELQNRKPNTLSGGQQQRVALARALVQKPPLLLLDEPLSALDQEMRIKLQSYLLEIHQKFGLTTILVSHEPQEVHRLSDMVYVVEQGRLVKTCTPDELFGEESAQQTLTYEAQVLAIEVQGESNKVTLAIHGAQVEHWMDKSMIQDWVVGQKVKLELDISAIRLKKSG